MSSQADCSQPRVPQHSRVRMCDRDRQLTGIGDAPGLGHRASLDRCGRWLGVGRHRTARPERLREPPGRVRRERRPGGRICARSRAGQPLRLLSHAEGSDARVHEGERRSGVALALRFIGGNPHARIEGVDRAPGEVSYLRGADPAAGTPVSRATVRSPIEISGPASTSTCASNRGPEVRVPRAPARGRRTSARTREPRGFRSMIRRADHRHAGGRDCATPRRSRTRRPAARACRCRAVTRWIEAGAAIASRSRPAATTIAIVS